MSDVKMSDGDFIRDCSFYPTNEGRVRAEAIAQRLDAMDAHQIDGQDVFAGPRVDLMADGIWRSDADVYAQTLAMRVGVVESSISYHAKALDRRIKALEDDTRLDKIIAALEAYQGEPEVSISPLRDVIVNALKDD